MMHLLGVQFLIIGMYLVGTSSVFRRYLVGTSSVPSVPRRHVVGFSLAACVVRWARWLAGLLAWGETGTAPAQRTVRRREDGRLSANHGYPYHHGCYSLSAASRRITDDSLPYQSGAIRRITDDSLPYQSGAISDVAG